MVVVLVVFNIHSVAKHQKIEGGNFYFRKNCRSAETNCKGDPLGFSNIHSDAKQQKTLKRGPFGEIFFEKKSYSAEKK